MNHTLSIKGLFESLDIKINDNPTMNLVLCDVTKQPDFPKFSKDLVDRPLIIEVYDDSKLFTRLVCNAKGWQFVIDSAIKFVCKTKKPSPFDPFMFMEIHGEEVELRINTKPTPAEIDLILDPKQSKLAKFEK